MFSTKKPKFSLNLTINELTNIPQVSGYCFIELQIKDSKRGLPGFTSFKTHSPAHDHSEKDGKDGMLLSKVESKLHGTSLSGISDSSSSSSTTSSGNVSVTTSKKRIHNFKCAFNYNLSCNLKFPYKRRENLIADKNLTLKVYYIHDSKNDNLSGKLCHPPHPHLNHDQTSELGKLEINLSEYLNFSEPTTSKYLLRDSKVNSILILTIGLTELPSNYEFHTQLQINDSHSGSQTFTDDKKDPQVVSQPTKFNVPQFERKKVFGGLNDVIQSPDSSTFSSQNLPSVSSTSSFDSDKNSSSHHRQQVSHSLTQNTENSSESSKKKPLSKLKLSCKSDNSNSSASNNAQSQVSNPADNSNNAPITRVQENIIMDPIITSLYKKILESTWDPELYCLLNYPPEECVKDLFECSSGKEFNQTYCKKLGTSHKPPEPESGDSRDLNGLINENAYRDDLRSWSINNPKALS